MKVICNRGALLDGLLMAGNVVASRTPKPVLQCVKLTAEENTLTGPVDATVGKNAIQAIGSTLTYLQRYSLVQALGLAASNDDDGRSVETGAFVSPSQLSKLNELADEVNADKVRFCKYLKVGSLAEIPAKTFAHAMQLLEAKRGGK